MVFAHSAHSSEPQKISGIVLDEVTQNPLKDVKVFYVEKKLTTTTDENGRFGFDVTAAESFSLEFSLISYKNRYLTFTPDSLRIIIVKLTPIGYSTPLISVTESFSESKYNELLEDAGVLKSKELQKDLGSTLAATLKNESGLSVRSMGPAPSRPVFRGLTGDRVLISEDGVKTNDLSGTSPDHAVTIEPFTLERIEVLRGPSVLTKTTTTIGGIVNVVRNDIPVRIPSRFTFQSGIFGETTNNGLLGAFAGELPFYNFVLRGEVSRRKADNLKTPVGTLQNSSLETDNYSGSLSYVFKNGYAGASFREFQSDYGIPGGFVGAHPKGVDISMLKRQLKFKTELVLNAKLIKDLQFTFNSDNYNHKEFEASGLIGAEFGIKDYNGELFVNHKKLGLLENGTWGISADYRDFNIGGYVFTSPTKSIKLSAYFYENVKLNKTSIEFAARYNYDNLNPEPLNPNSGIGLITERTFNTFSFSVSAIQDIAENFHIGASLSRSSRVPTIEELYSEGPHLAAYSYEIGNPYLQDEWGIGSELFVHYKSGRVYTMISLFVNNLPYYIIPRNSGDTNYATLLPIYKTSGESAFMFGFESQLDYNFWKHLSFTANISYTNGRFNDTKNPLPAIPPVKGLFEVNYKRENFAFGINTELAAAQNRVDDFETETPGYGIMNTYAQYSLVTEKFIHSLSVNFENMFNKEYRNHLSRVRSIMPEAGRNLRLTYKIFF
ncbi:MAG: TonB-dependent receptor [Ignavibacteria bacterium]|nr:TonB-dependent receptor [Ignavibacteria bacterium]